MWVWRHTFTAGFPLVLKNWLAYTRVRVIARSCGDWWSGIVWIDSVLSITLIPEFHKFGFASPLFSWEADWVKVSVPWWDRPWALCRVRCMCWQTAYCQLGKKGSVLSFPRAAWLVSNCVMMEGGSLLLGSWNESPRLNQVALLWGLCGNGVCNCESCYKGRKQLSKADGIKCNLRTLRRLFACLFCPRPRSFSPLCSSVKAKIIEMSWWRELFGTISVSLKLAKWS